MVAGRTGVEPGYLGCLVIEEYGENDAVRFIQPGKPVQNAYIESYNGKFWDECLNDNVFVSLQSAREIIENWRQDYNAERLHSSLSDMTPEEFARTFIRDQKTENTNQKLAL